MTVVAESKAIDTGFRPSKNGYPFANDRGWGLCGGFVYGALNAWKENRPVPQEYDAGHLLLWQIYSLCHATAVKFLTLSRLSDADLKEQSEKCLPELLKALRQNPVPLGIIYASETREVFLNHQVLAYKGTMKNVWVYDPNRVDDDGATLKNIACRGWFLK